MRLIRYGQPTCCWGWPRRDTTDDRIISPEYEIIRLTPRTPARGQRAVASVSREVQKAQRRAAIGTSLRHSGHFLVVGSGAISPRRIRARVVFIGSTMKKYTAAAIRMNETSALIKSPIGSRSCSEGIVLDWTDNSGTSSSIWR
jgi:hypothetical protein